MGVSRKEEEFEFVMGVRRMWRLVRGVRFFLGGCVVRIMGIFLNLSRISFSLVSHICSLWTSFVTVRICKFVWRRDLQGEEGRLLYFPF